MKIHTLLLAVLWALCLRPVNAADGPARSNILWLASEDHGIEMGCYGDKFATTPNVDKLAARGMISTHAWSCAPLCAPSRTTLISGMYTQSTGGGHMRSLVPHPAGKQMSPLLAGQADWCEHGVFSAVAALNSIDALGAKASPISSTIKTMAPNGPAPNARFKSYVPRLVEELQVRFK